MVLFLYRWLIPSLLSLSIDHHPFYVSVAELEYISKDREIGITCKFFTEDIEETLRMTTGQKIDLAHGDKTANGKYLNDYVARHFRLKVEGTLVSPLFIGMEQEQEATWCYLSVPNISSCRKVEIFNDLLYDFKKEQVNLVHVTVNGTRKSNRLVYPDNIVKLEF